MTRHFRHLYRDCPACQPETPPLWAIFIMSVIGAAALLPSFALWQCARFKRQTCEWDERLTFLLHRPEQQRFWRLIARLGDGWLYAAAYIMTRQTRIAAACFLAWGIGSALKILVRRTRQNPIRRRVKLFTKLGAWSFPSQHAAVAVAFACAWPNPLSVTMAAAICASRVLTGAHYLGDVLAGVLVGLVAGKLA